MVHSSFETIFILTTYLIHIPHHQIMNMIMNMTPHSSSTSPPTMPLMNNTPSTTPPTPSRPSYIALPRTRETCDACAKAKIRCSKQRPSCERCVARGLLCRYGLLRPRGRPRGRLVGVEVEGSGGESSPGSPGEGCLGVSGVDGVGDIPAPAPASQPETAEGETVQNWQTLNQNLDQFFDVAPPPSGVTQQPEYEIVAIPSSTSPSLSSGVSPASGAIIHDQSCMSMLLSILQSLHPPSETCLHRQSTVLPRTVDSIVPLNQNAMNTITLVLGCPCALSSSFGLVIAQVLLQILDGYRGVLDDPDPTVGMGRMQGTEGDEIDRRRRVVQVVNELDQVRALIEVFARGYCREGAVGGGNQQVCLILEGELRRRLGGVMTAAVLRVAG
ncbi:uncharacterized protein BO80DRAFT_224269 [Aspergillus ibericus CBS 121593]|uniref:Zn(2)-C6 fungal-type domain-containing protein n=1 Tax=Aspergillus ibericus CBS 121593 TaxID=1448316 RepID=A0A395GM47_9EURO|nr:hypothetical protein BO80DRAFT_224269 [Aspergillus ibericus CBS 121593]RAK96590.1 hypothetical protein BO80DRAFT_224269 [Aspergillus ibericus CBS 121593]